MQVLHLPVTEWDGVLGRGRHGGELIIKKYCPTKIGLKIALSVSFVFE
jgi:hypothetical protein